MAGLASSDVTRDMTGEAGPPVVPLDELGGLVASRVSCERRVMMSSYDVLTQRAIVWYVDKALVLDDAVGLDEHVRLLLESLNDLVVP